MQILAGDTWKYFFIRDNPYALNYDKAQLDRYAKIFTNESGNKYLKNPYYILNPIEPDVYFEHERPRDQEKAIL